MGVGAGNEFTFDANLQFCSLYNNVSPPPTKITSYITVLACLCVWISASESVFRLQLLRGRPLFLLPCGFQVRAWRVVLASGFLRVCPIQPHFLRRICSATGSCPARSHKSSFYTSIYYRSLSHVHITFLALAFVTICYVYLYN